MGWLGPLDTLERPVLGGEGYEGGFRRVIAHTCIKPSAPGSNRHEFEQSSTSYWVVSFSLITQEAAQKWNLVNSYHPYNALCRLRTASRVAGTINSTLYVSCNAILARIELRSNHTVFAEWPANLLANLADVTVWVELLADSAS